MARWAGETCVADTGDSIAVGGSKATLAPGFFPPECGVKSLRQSLFVLLQVRPHNMAAVTALRSDGHRLLQQLSGLAQIRKH
jgi:hypothetical protein